MVENRWNPDEFAKATSLLEQRVYSSRLLGGDARLVMHGGGNTSVKDEIKDILGQPEPVLYIKGSGWDLGTIEKPGFPAVRMNRVRRLRELTSLDDITMMNELRASLVTHPSPDPSVEALLHAFLPHRFVDHTHADAVLTLTNQPNAADKIREVFGETIGIVPYVMPGFLLAKLCAEVFEKNPRVEGLILLKHGIFSFGETAKESYDRMITLVNKAEKAVERSARLNIPADLKPRLESAPWMAALRNELQRKKFSAVLWRDSSASALTFAGHLKIEELCQRGPLTPDHVIRTKRLPLVVERPQDLPTKLEKYADEYQRYFDTHSKARPGLTKLDPWPRVFVIPGLGVITAGTTLKDARIASDIFSHTVECILLGEQLERYEALPAQDIFDVEYWCLEQAKLKLGAQVKPLTGKVAVVTGGAGGIGRGITEEFLRQGAVVFALDKNPATLARLKEESPSAVRGNLFTLTVDVGAREEMAEAFSQVVGSVGGIDILVVNAGIFPRSETIDSISADAWDDSMRVNVDGAFYSFSESLKWMKAQPRGGDVVLVASKNVPAPGKGAGAYSVAKAAQTQLARVAALEGASHGIRVNTLHPHLILDTALWSPDVLEGRAKAYGMSVEEYKTNNLLKTSLSSQDVAKAAFALVAGYFSKTTGAQIPVDGGSDRTL